MRTTVLVVEDDSWAQTMLRTLLAAEGYGGGRLVARRRAADERGGLHDDGMRDGGRGLRTA